MNKHQTADEKLLSLIRKKDRSRRKILKTDFKSTGNRFKNPVIFLKLFRLLNRILLAACLGTVIFIMFKFWQTSGSNQFDVKIQGVSDRTRPQQNDYLETPMQSFEEYKQLSKQRNLFSSPWEKEDQQVVVPEREASFSQGLNLVGIVLDQNPQAILEDTQSKQTFFVNIGDQVGEAEVQEIHEDKVIFLIQGETVSLTR